MFHRKFPKPLALLMVAAILMSLFTFAPLASAADMYSCPNPKTVIDDNPAQMLGALFVEVPAGMLLGSNDFFEVELGGDFDISGITAQTVLTPRTTNDTNDAVCVVVPTKVGDNVNALSTTDVTAKAVDENKVVVTVNNSVNNAVYDAYIRVYFNKVDIADGASGDIVATVTGFGGFTSGEVPIGTVGQGKATISIKDVANLAGDGNLENITILENAPGALDADDESIKLILPNGFEWDPNIGPSNLDVSGGLTGKVSISSVVGDTLAIKLNSVSTGTRGKIVLKNLPVVVDEGDADFGEVKVKVRGESDITPDELVVAKYAEYGVSIATDGDLETLYAGQYAQEITKMVITEDAKGSLVVGRSVTFKLPANAKWVSVPDSLKDNTCELKLVGFVGDDYRTIKYEVIASSSDAAEIDVENMEVALEPNVTGDLVVTVDGTAGLEDEIVVAKVVNPVNVTVDNVAELKIGSQGQPAGTITLTEVDSEVIKKGDLIIDLPDGVTFAALPTVTVDGDLEIDESNVKRANDDNELVIPIEDESNDASTITISNIKLSVDRTVAEGDIVAKIKGDAVVEVNDSDAIKADFSDASNDSGWQIEVATDSKSGKPVYLELDQDSDGNVEGFFPNSTSAVKVTVARVGTPAEGGKTVSFKIGDEGVTAMNGRTLVQVNLLCDTLGLQKSWDAASKTAYFVKDGTVVAFPIGKNQIVINGNAIPVDQGGVAYNNFTYATLRGIQMAFGGELTWDQATQTATFKF